MNAFTPSRSDFNTAVQDSLAADNFDPAKVEGDFVEFDKRFNDLVAEREAIELAVAIEAHGENPDAAPSFLARADPFRKLAKSPKKAAARLETLTEAIDDLRPQWMLARHQRQLAREERARQLAVTFKPRHQKTVHAISQALNMLSAAVASEQDLHREFLAQTQDIAGLPDFGGQWRGALLSEPRSAASMWMRAAKAMGYIR